MSTTYACDHCRRPFIEGVDDATKWTMVDVTDSRKRVAFTYCPDCEWVCSRSRFPLPLTIG